MNSLTPQTKPSPRFFFPKNGKLFSYSTLSSAETRSAVQNIDEELNRLTAGTHFPRPSTRIAVKRKEYRIGVYSNLGEKDLISELKRDLLFFLHEQELSESSYLTFIAVFNDSDFESDTEFDQACRKHLSFLTDEKGLADLGNKDLHFNFEGFSFSVVGVHPYSSKEANRFEKPALIFNLVEQMEQLKDNLNLYSKENNQGKVSINSHMAS